MPRMSFKPDASFFQKSVAILVLLSGGWSQLSALDCPMGYPSAISHASTYDVMAHESHEQHASTSANDEGRSAPDGSHQSDSECRLLMTCARAVLARLDPGVDRRPVSIASAHPPFEQSHATVFLNHEPPPPRLPV